MKKIFGKKFYKNTKFNFTSSIEEEIKRSYINLSQQFKIQPIHHEPMLMNIITLKDIEKKFFAKKSENDGDDIIKQIYKEEVLNMKTGKQLDDLILFITNCKKYNYNHYLQDIKYFKDKEIRNKMTNTSLLESLKNKDSPYNVQNIFNTKFKIQNLLNLRKGQKGEKLDTITMKEFEKTKYEYLNYLCETPKYDKLNSMNQNKNIEQKKEDVVSYDSYLNELSVQKNYIDYLNKVKRKDKIDSFGVSKLETRFSEKAEDIYNISHLEKEEDKKGLESESVFDENEITSECLTLTNADFYKNGVVESYPYENMEDYNYHEFLDDESNFPDKILRYKTLNDINDFEELPPKHIFDKDKRQVEFHVWGMFTFLHNTKHHYKKFFKEMADVIHHTSNTISIKSAPSIIHYYQLYPKWVREHPTMQMIVRGLEKYNPLIPFKTKLHMLNIAAKYIFPVDEKLLEVNSEFIDVMPKNLTLEDLPELAKEEEKDEIMILPDDYYTEEEDLEGNIITAAMVRVWEKEEEEERKQKRREEGRAKRAAEEAKNSGMPAPKVDKGAEEKKKEEDEMVLMEEEQKRIEEEKQAEEDKIKEEEREKKKKKKLEFSEKKFKKREITDKDILEDLAKSPLKKTEFIQIKENTKKIIKTKIGDEEVELEENKKEDNNIRNQKEKEEENKDKIELKMRKDRKERQLKYGKKMFEDKTEDIRMERIEKVFEYIKSHPDLTFKEKISKISNEYKTNDDIHKHVYVALMKSELINSEEKELITSIFDIKDSLETIRRDLKKRDEERIKEYNLMLDLLDVASTQMETLKNYSLDDMYQISLKEHDIEIQNTDDKGLKDVYVKPTLSPDYVERPYSYSVPVDYYINDDGFWDSYIKEKQDNVDIKLYTEKPFIFYKNRLKRVVDDI